MYENVFSPLEPLDDLEEALPLPDPAVMLKQLYSHETFPRMQAARAFCDLVNPQAIDRLIELLEDECALVRVSAAYALGRNTAPQAVEPLIQTLRWDWNGYVRKGAVWALGNARDPRSLPVLLEVLTSDITAVRLWAASALGQVGGEETVAPLVAAMQSDPVTIVRSNAIWSLGQVLALLNLANGTAAQKALYHRAISTIICALRQEEDEGVREDARDTLQKLQDPDGLKAIAELEADFLL